MTTVRQRNQYSVRVGRVSVSKSGSERRKEKARARAIARAKVSSAQPRKCEGKRLKPRV